MADSQSRRLFLQSAAAGSALALNAQSPHAAIFLLSDASDETLAEAPVEWAAGELRRALGDQGIASSLHANLDAFDAAALRIVIAPASSQIARRAAAQLRLTLPTHPESLALFSSKIRGRDALLLAGGGARGLVYAILELADRLQYAPDPRAVLTANTNTLEQPANEIRSVQRLFVSDVEDKGWYHDKSFWNAYLTMLAAQRFNRFSLTLGLGYDLPRSVLDSYFIFAYPFLLVRVPGYNVTVPGLPAGEPERNLEMLQWLGAETARRGLHFQLSLRSQAYQCIDSPKVNYLVDGLNAANHAPYCRDALKLLLRECPSIAGVTLRAHSESGIGDGSYDFWKTVFSAFSECGRRVELDLHSKGIDHRQIQMALDTGQPVRISCKYTAEHMGLPGHQIAIRDLERKQASSTPQERAFTRYGYADYLPADRPYGTYFRLWPGKDRVVLWGDPAITAAYGRFSGFCGALGLEMCEPLSFKGRQGSGLYPDRRIYADSSLAPQGGGWRKYLYTYRLWGRHLYNPDCDPESYRRYLRSEFGAAAAPAEQALAAASKTIPLVTSAHLPSAAGMSYWPEIYSNMPVADEKQRHIYGDTPVPKVFGHVSALDPGLFMSAWEYAAELTGAPRSGRYSPADVARWLDAFAATAESQIQQARAQSPHPAAASFRRLHIDVAVQSGLGRFFAAKMRSAIAWSLYQKQGRIEDLRAALYYARAARDAWTAIVRVTKGVYLDDLTFGAPPHRRGSWSDRLPSIQQDVSPLEQLLAAKSPGPLPALQPPAAAWLKARPAAPACRHTPPAAFTPGQPLPVSVSAPRAALQEIRLHYRHVQQAESYEVQPMAAGPAGWAFTIPAAYTNTRFALQYYFQLIARDGSSWLYPGLEPSLANQPYYVVRRAPYFASFGRSPNSA